MDIPRSLTVAGLLGFAAACGGDSTEPEPSAPAIAAQSGDSQSAEAGTSLANPVVVRISQDGAALSGKSVSWSVTAGGGSVSPSTSSTDGTGLASTVWTLGSSAGTNTLQASASGATGSPVTFNATATTATLPTTAAIKVDDNFYDPSSVTIAAGGTVTWTWVGSSSHSVTFTSGSSSTTLTSGTFSRSFATVGTYQYSCIVHGASMSGEIVVQ